MAKNSTKTQEKKSEKKENAMSVDFISKIADALKEVSSLCKSVIDAGDPEKYARSVEQLNHGVSNTYEQMRQIIVSSEKFSDEEKLERLTKLAEQEEESKKKCDEAIKGNREQVAHIALEVAKGLLTCGIYYVPAITRSLKGKNQKELPEVTLEAIGTEE